MTRLIVLSDSHGDVDAIRRVLTAEKTIGAVVYLGDGMRDLEQVMSEFKGLRFYAVRGNCDFHSFEPIDALAPFDRVIAYYTHGHMHGVKYELEALIKAASVRGATLALFGHTHKPYCEQHQGITLFNPGSCGRCYTGENTYGVITLQEGEILSCTHCPVPPRTTTII